MSIFPEARFLEPDFQQRLVEFRRDIHRHPELGFHETRTAGKVSARLEELGIPHQTGVAHTGVVGLIEGAEPGPTVMIRADMDALPLPEATEVPYRSLVPNAMHACGHDAHTAILLGVAEVMMERRDQLPGKVKLIFQPAEEGPGGAEPMIAEGVLKNPDVDYALGLHVWNRMPRGHVGILPGKAMAAVDMFDIKFTSRGGHGAVPHQVPDPIIAASHAVQSLQAIASRETDPLESLVISVCQLNGGFADNIIPNAVTLRGTVRTFDDKVREDVPKQMERIVEGIAGAYQCGHEFGWRPFYPATINDPRVAALVAAVTREMDGQLSEDRTQRPCMGGEDMSYFLREVPGCFFFLGSCPEGTEDDPPPHHSDRFDIDERCMPEGVEVLVRSAERLLTRGLEGC